MSNKSNECNVEPSNKHTALYEQHLALGAKMATVAGWELPLHFGSQVDEHQEVRKDCGVFDVSFMMIVDITGIQAKEFLSYLLANDINLLDANNVVLPSVLLNEAGGIIDNVLVYLLDSNSYRMAYGTNLQGKTIAWINQQSQKFSVDIQLRDDLAAVSVQGPNAINRLVELLNANFSNKLIELAPCTYCYVDNWLFSRTGYTGEDGIDIILPLEQVEIFWLELIGYGIMPIGMNARDTLRLEAGLNCYGQDMDEKISPLACNMNSWLAWSPINRDFIGRAAVAKMLQEGCSEKLVGIVSEERSILQKGQVLRVEDVGEGIISSTNFSPTIGKYIALARVPIATAFRAEVEIKGKWYPVRVVSPCFVCNGSVLI